MDMVKPFEEEQAGRLSEREAKTLLTIFFRYIKDAYKQFKWGVNLGRRYDTLFHKELDALITTDGNRATGPIFIGVAEIEVNEVRLLQVYLTAKGAGFNQAFPITEKSPRELGRLAKNMFKWVKQQMEKL